MNSPSLYAHKREETKLWPTELRMVAKIFSLNISVREPNIMQHEAITNKRSLLVLMSPVKFILIYSNIQFLFSVTKLSRFWAMSPLHPSTSDEWLTNDRNHRILSTVSPKLDTWVEWSLSKETRRHGQRGWLWITRLSIVLISCR